MPRKRNISQVGTIYHSGYHSGSAGSLVHQPSQAIYRHISEARRRSGFDWRHASRPLVVDVMDSRTSGSLLTAEIL